MQGEEMLRPQCFKDHDFKWYKLAGKINKHVLTCLSNEKGCRIVYRGEYIYNVPLVHVRELEHAVNCH